MMPLDSMAQVLVAVEIERRIVPVPDDELRAPNFGSLDMIVAMTERLLADA
jgi:hypothetical protein